MMAVETDEEDEMTTAALLALVAKWRAEADRLSESVEGKTNGVVITALVSSATMYRACATELERALEGSGDLEPAAGWEAGWEQFKQGKTDGTCCGEYGGTHLRGVHNGYCDCDCHAARCDNGTIWTKDHRHQASVAP